MEHTLKTFREETVQLICKAYSSIKMSDLTQYIGLDETGTGQLITELGWTFNQQSGRGLCLVKHRFYLERVFCNSIISLLIVKLMYDADYLNIGFKFRFI